MEAVLQEIVDEVLQKFKNLSDDSSRLLVGIAGGPGSGKSTLAYPLVDRINAALGHGSSSSADIDQDVKLAQPVHASASTVDSAVARSISMDGWHLTRAQLDVMPNPEEARFRRGAPFTFDANGYLSFVQALRSNTSTPIPVPTFEHAIKDPVMSDEPLLPHQRIIVIEGLYVLLDEDIWREAAELLNFKIYVDIERERSRERLINRNFAAGLTATREETIHRVDASDMLNRDLVATKMVHPDKVVYCAEDPAFAQVVQ